MFAPERSYPTEDQATWVLYDLRIPGAFERAREDREAWGREYAAVSPMGLDHVLIAFVPGGARRLVPQTPDGPRKKT